MRFLSHLLKICRKVEVENRKRRQPVVLRGTQQAWRSASELAEYSNFSLVLLAKYFYNDAIIEDHETEGKIENSGRKTEVNRQLGRSRGI
jgi:hypothetical protein